MKSLDDLKPTLRIGRTLFTKEDGEAIIRAARRGVDIEDIAQTVEIKRNNLYFRLGRWALRFATIPPVKEVKP